MKLLTGQARSDFWEARSHKYEAKLARLVLSGVLDARQLSEFHWRVWNVRDPMLTADYWPRTGTVQVGEHIRRDTVLEGWKYLCRVLSAPQGGRSDTVSTKPDVLDQKIDMIYKALDRAEPSRLLREWREDPDEDAVEAMRRAIRRVDGCLNVTTDALVAAFDACLSTLTSRGKVRHG